MFGGFACLILSLREGESGCAIADARQTSQANASKHLSVLRDADTIGRQRKGGYVFYRVGGHVPYPLIDAVCMSLDAQTAERKSLLDSAQQEWAVHAA